VKISNLISNNSLNRILKILNLKYLIKSDVKRLKIIKSIIKNQSIERNGYTLSNYGVWMLNNYLDKTFQLSITGYRNNLEKILLSINQPLIFIDIGANQGVFSLVAAKNKSFVEIHAFEPNLKLTSYLQSNFFMNKVNSFFIHKVAIGPQSTSISFFVPENHSGNGRVSSQKANMQVVSVNRDYLNKVFIQSNKFYFIKIDVEGSERNVLYELFNSNINLNIKYIFIEINTKFSKEDFLIEILRSNGFYEASRSGDGVSYDALYIR
jgi:FkbM family methyltransferase